MQFRERIHAVLRGERTDEVPFAPYDVLIPRGGFEREMRNRGMGLCARSWSISERTPSMRTERFARDGIQYCLQHTPAGSLRRGMKHAGRITGREEVEAEFPVKEGRDLAALIALIDDTVYDADHEAYRAQVRDLGDDGIVRLEGPTAPYEWSLMEEAGMYMSLPTWAELQADCPEEFARLLEALEKKVERMLPHVLESPVEFVSLGWFGGLFSPAMFAQHLLPYFQELVPVLERAGKICSLHVIEAFTPPPVGDLSLAEAREAFGPDTVIWVNFPETLFWPGRQQTYDYTVDLLKQDAGSGRLVIGMTEMGMYGAVTEETERVFKEGMRGIADAIGGSGG